MIEKEALNVLTRAWQGASSLPFSFVQLDQATKIVLKALEELKGLRDEPTVPFPKGRKPKAEEVVE